MRFRLIYAGSLKASGTKPRPKEKEAVREYVSPQLSDLWTTHPGLQGIGLTFEAVEPLPANHRFLGGKPIEHSVRVRQQQQEVNNTLLDLIEVEGRCYLPIVRNSLRLTCELEILFLRKDGVEALVGNSGDLDNRIKTLFDGLRVPRPGEVKLGPVLPEEKDTFKFCLLEDDSLVTGFSVRTDRLLTRPGAASNEVLLVIEVIIRPTTLSTYNFGFLGG